MRRILSAAVAAALAPAAWANYTIEDTTIHCSGAFSASFGNALKLTCSGDLFLQGTSELARIQASESIELFASGPLDWPAGAVLQVGGSGGDMNTPGWIRGVGGEISLRGLPDRTILQPGHIQLQGVAGAVPEPSAWLLVCMGALGVMAWQRQHARR